MSGLLVNWVVVSCSVVSWVHGGCMLAGEARGSAGARIRTGVSAAWCGRRVRAGRCGVPGRGQARRRLKREGCRRRRNSCERRRCGACARRLGLNNGRRRCGTGVVHGRVDVIRVRRPAKCRRPFPARTTSTAGDADRCAVQRTQARPCEDGPVAAARSIHRLSAIGAPAATMIPRCVFCCAIRQLGRNA